MEKIYARKSGWYLGLESNPRPLVFQTSALTKLSYLDISRALTLNKQLLVVSLLLRETPRKRRQERFYKSILSRNTKRPLLLLLCFCARTPKLAWQGMMDLNHRMRQSKCRALTELGESPRGKSGLLRSGQTLGLIFYV